MRHNEIRNAFAKIMQDVFRDVELERTLQLLQEEFFLKITTTSTDENVRIDTTAKGL